MFKRLAIVLLSLTLLTSCGFKLRGNFEMPAALDQVTIEGGNREIVELLTELLEKSGSTVVPEGSDAANLNLTKTEFERETLTTESSGIASSYTFRYLVDFNVTDSEGKLLQEPMSINQIRNLQYEAGNELAVENEEDFLKEEMEKELVLQIMRRLSRL